MGVLTEAYDDVFEDLLDELGGSASMTRMDGGDALTVRALYRSQAEYVNPQTGALERVPAVHVLHEDLSGYVPRGGEVITWGADRADGVPASVTVRAIMDEGDNTRRYRLMVRLP